MKPLMILPPVVFAGLPVAFAAALIGSVVLTILTIIIV